jgi:hypothetical protein
MLVRFTSDNISTSTTNSDNKESTIINNSNNNQKQQQNQKNYDKRRKTGRRSSSSSSSTTIRSEGIKLKIFEESTLPPINKPSFYFHKSNQLINQLINEKTKSPGRTQKNERKLCSF